MAFMLYRQVGESAIVEMSNGEIVTIEIDHIRGFSGSVGPKVRLAFRCPDTVTVRRAEAGGGAGGKAPSGSRAMRALEVALDQLRCQISHFPDECGATIQKIERILAGDE